MYVQDHKISEKKLCANNNGVSYSQLKLQTLGEKTLQPMTCMYLVHAATLYKSPFTCHVKLASSIMIILCYILYCAGLGSIHGIYNSENTKCIQ